MMLNWNEYRQQVLTGVGEMGKLSPETVKGYVGLSAAGQKKDLLGAKTRELIALAVAVALNAGAALVCSTRVKDAYAAHG